MKGWPFANRAAHLRSWSRPVWAQQQQVKCLVPSFTRPYRKSTFKMDWWTVILSIGRMHILENPYLLVLFIYFLPNSCSAPHHFNSESFLEGRALIIEGLATIKSNIRLENFKAARETLGRSLHVLQVRGCEWSSLQTTVQTSNQPMSE